MNGLGSPVVTGANNSDSEVIIVRSGRSNFLNYIYLVYDKTSKDAVIIDPGWDAEYLINLCIENKITLKGIFSTHSHQDHIAAAGDISDEFDIPIHLSEIEIGLTSFRHKNLVACTHEQTVTSGNMETVCLHTPGHTAGSFCYLIGNSLYTGDTIFIEGCGLCSGPSGSTSEMFSTIQFLKQRIPDRTLVLPGHKYKYEIGPPFERVKSTNIYFKLSNEKTFDTFCNRNARLKNTPPPPETATDLGTHVHQVLAV